MMATESLNFDESLEPSVENQSHKLIDKIQSWEISNKRRISYSVGQGDRSLTILREPITQEIEVDWGEDNKKIAQATRYIGISPKYGLVSLDFHKAHKFDSSDNTEEKRDTLGNITQKGNTYPEEGIWIDNPSEDMDSGRSEQSFLRSIGNYDMKKSINSGLTNNPDGSHGISLGTEFANPIFSKVDSNDFFSALETSIEKSKTPETIKPSDQIVALNEVLDNIDAKIGE